MDYPITFTIQTPAELYAFLQQNQSEINQTTIEKVYNLGLIGFLEYSLFLLTKHHAVNLFFTTYLSIDVYPRAHFLKTLSTGIFRSPADPDDFIYISQPENVNLRIKQIKPYFEEFGGCKQFVGIDLFLTKGKTLHIERDDLVPNAMSSWLK